jgi:DNA-binding transcriptional LysR family regulator
MFTLAQLSHFVAVAEELHFGRAAERLHMTQPPLSRQIQLLEKALDVRLFDRTSRSVTLTPAGKTFLDDARRILQQADRAALSVRKAAEGKSGLLRVGFTAGSVFSGLTSILARTRSAIPGVEIELRELVTTLQIDALTDGSLDVGLLRPPTTRPDLSSRALVREDLVIALPKGSPLDRGDTVVDVADLDGAPLVMYTPIEARYFYDLLSSVFHQAGVAPTPVHHLSQIHSILALVDLGWGVALVPESARNMRFGNLVYRPLRLASAASVELDLVWRADNPNPALALLLDSLAKTDSGDGHGTDIDTLRASRDT